MYIYVNMYIDKVNFFFTIGSSNAPNLGGGEVCRTHTWTYSCFTHGTSMGTIHLSRNLADAHT